MEATAIKQHINSELMTLISICSITLQAKLLREIQTGKTSYVELPK
jgi:hypothetical protein